MVKNKVKEKEIEEKILKIFDEKRVPLSIRQVTLALKENFKVELSPQIVKRYILKLKKENRILAE